MKEIVRVLLQEGIDEETIHEVLNIIDEKSGMDGLEGGITARYPRLKKATKGNTISKEQGTSDYSPSTTDKRGVKAKEREVSVSKYAPDIYKKKLYAEKSYTGEEPPKISHDSSKAEVGQAVSKNNGRGIGPDNREKKGVFEDPTVKALVRQLKKISKTDAVKNRYKTANTINRSANAENF